MQNANRHTNQAVATNDWMVDARRPEIEDRSAEEGFTRVVARLSVLGEMSGGIAHDFRNILATIDSCLRLAEQSLDEPETALRFVAGAREGVTRGLRLTSQLLTLAQHGEAQACTANATSMLEDLKLFLKCAAGQSVRVVFDLRPTIPDCLVDPSQFAAAVLNLVINARDAMPDGGEVRISTDCCDVAASAPRQVDTEFYVRVRIEDGGSGMPEHVAKRIFEPFFTTKGEKGSGLGIPQVCAFMRRMGGRVSIASEPRRGTTFDLLFPALLPDGAVTLDVRGTPGATSS